MSSKDLQYYKKRLKSFFSNPILYLKIRKLKDVKLMPNLYERYVDTDSIINLSRSISSSKVINIEDFLSHKLIKKYFDHKSAFTLGELFDKFGSDKANKHNYNLIYQPILSNLLQLKAKDSFINIFEVGIGSNNIDVLSNMGLLGKPGASARAFREFDLNINLYMGDVDKRVLINEERINSVYVDQLNVSTLNNYFNLEKINLAIDDGLHILRANLNFLITALQFTEKDSWIVIEDIRESDLPFWNMVHDNFKKLAEVWLVKTKAAYLFILYMR